jgi:ligand-binding sensor domain-containing protein/serine phosphatase RsbU (regulator of sigma subunit)
LSRPTLLRTVLLLSLLCQGGPAEAARSVVAGDGVRRDGWQTFDIPDGLPSAEIISVFQQQNRDVWLATNSGSCRYDGAVFTTYTQADGLPSDSTTAFAQTAEGIWIATRSGLTRFDGHTFSPPMITGRIHSLVQHDGSLWAGTDSGLWRIDAEAKQNYTRKDGLPSDEVSTLFSDGKVLWIGTESGVASYDGQFRPGALGGTLSHQPVSAIYADGDTLWLGLLADDVPGIVRFDTSGVQTYGLEGVPPGDIWATSFHRTADGDLLVGSFGQGVLRLKDGRLQQDVIDQRLAHMWVSSLYADTEGSLWVGTMGGVSRYDADQFRTFGRAEGLTEKRVYSLSVGAGDSLWIGTWAGGVNLLAGGRLSHIDRDDGLLDNDVTVLSHDSQGRVWVGNARGVSLIDGTSVTAFAEYPDESRVTWAIAEDDEGAIWIGSGRDGGLVKYTDGELVTYTAADGFAQNTVRAILPAKDGRIWFGTHNGLSLLDDSGFTTYTVKDGLPHNHVRALTEDHSGNLWIGTWGGGLSKYDGVSFHNFSARDGLASDIVRCLMEDRRGHIWIGTWGGGISRYDGLVFQSLLRRDGVAHNVVAALTQDRDGTVWIGSEGGLNAYSPRSNAPPIRIVDVLSDKRHGPVDRLMLPRTQDFVALEFAGRNYHTRPEQMAYVYRLVGLQDEWTVTREHRVEYTGLPLGQYKFEVKSVDRDLNYSSVPATVEIDVHIATGEFVRWSAIALALIVALSASGYSLRRRQLQLRAERALMAEMSQEIETARQIQVGLLPTATPQVAGYDIDGRCLPAASVNGDFYQYLTPAEGRFAIVVADAAGHAMEAAIPAVMFSSVLDSQLQFVVESDDILGGLNRVLCRNLPRRSFVCTVIADFELAHNRIRIFNAGSPYPMLYRAASETVTEIELAAYPLGVREATSFSSCAVDLALGDCLLLYSDGLVEAIDEAGEQFGYERLVETLLVGCQRRLSSSELIEFLIETVGGGGAGSGFDDDLTCVVAMRTG